MSKSKFDPTDSEKLSDTELSKKLGQYQKQARTWLRVGLLCIAGGLISVFTVQNTALKAIVAIVLFGCGACCVSFLSDGARKKQKALMQEQLGDFFRTELEKSFGSGMHTPEMHIDKQLLKALYLLDGKWEECAVENFYEGNYSGIHFSSANVRLEHVYKQGVARDGVETRHDMVFKGVVMRCETHISASSVRANVRSEDSPRGVVTGNETFDSRFCVTAETEQEAVFLLTPQFVELIYAFQQRLKGQILCFCWDGNVFSLVIETDYSFAAVASNVNIRDLNAVRHSYRNSLREMETLLDILLKNTVLFGNGIEREERT